MRTVPVEKLKKRRWKTLEEFVDTDSATITNDSLGLLISINNYFLQFDKSHLGSEVDIGNIPLDAKYIDFTVEIE